MARRPLAGALTAVGVFSYSLYLVHYPTNMVLRELFGFIAAPATTGIALAAMAVKIVVSVVVAAIFFQLVERRFLNQPSRSGVAHDAVTALR